MPFGATPTPQGTQFAVFSRHATAVSLLLFDSPEDATPAHEIPLDPRLNRTGDVWHIQVDGVGPGSLYLYRVDGPYDPEKGHRFNRNKLLLDPYVKAVTGNFTWHLADARGFDPASPKADLSFSTTSDVAGMPKGIVVSDEFDWRGDRPLNRPLRFSVIYETHVRSLTLHPSSGVAHPGTFRGVAEKIPYFKDLGITAVELLPVQEFDELENPHVNPRTGERLQNYWGYNTICFLRPQGTLLQLAAPLGAAGHRVQGDGARASRGRHRGHPRHRVQPHGGGGRDGPHAVLPRLGQLHLLPAGREQPAAATATTAGAATR